jgi:hypothetical protein
MIGGIVGGVVAVAAAVLALFLFKRKKANPTEVFDTAEPQEEFDGDSTFDGDEGIFVSEYGFSEKPESTEGDE